MMKLARVMEDEAQGMVRAQRPQDFGVTDDVQNAQRRNAQHPRQRDGPENRPIPPAPLLHHKQTEQHEQRQRQDELVESFGYHLQALDRRQHGNRRSDDTVPIEQ